MRLLLILFLCTSSIAFSQQPLEWGLEYREKIGFLAAHRGVMGHLPQSQAYAGELTWYINTKGRKQWHESCNFPSYGLTAFYGSVGNNELLGRFSGLYGFIEFPFMTYSHIRFVSKLGSGLGYTPYVFNQQTNPKNTAMSTHLNALICIGLKTEFFIKRNKLTFGLDLTHFSNGAMKVPNLGINLPYLSFGFARLIRKAEKDSFRLHQSLSDKP
jgi:hypothetical protein